MVEEKYLIELFQKHFGNKPIEIKALKGGGSDRTIFRLKTTKTTAIGVIGKNSKENQAFIDFSRVFFANNIPVPEILQIDLKNNVYLETDLGDETLFSWASAERKDHGFSNKIIDIYKKVIDYLPLIQIIAGAHINYTLCYQHIEFAKESMMWDMHYFKWNFLNVFYQDDINNELLEQDFEQVANFLLQEKKDFFLYRDFQSRNVMIKNEQPYFIDYQSGRRGALQYDLASLLYDSKANIPQEIREQLLDYYIIQAEKYTKINNQQFKKYFYGFALIRIMQALGAYGFLGIVKNKPHFLASVPFAISNLKILFEKCEFLNELPELNKIITSLCQQKIKILNKN